MTQISNVTSVGIEAFSDARIRDGHVSAISPLLWGFGLSTAGATSGGNVFGGFDSDKMVRVVMPSPNVICNPPSSANVNGYVCLNQDGSFSTPSIMINLLDGTTSTINAGGSIPSALSDSAPYTLPENAPCDFVLPANSYFGVLFYLNNAPAAVANVDMYVNILIDDLQ